VSKNMELARIFAEIADVLDLTGANAFKVNANRKVARTLEEAGEDLAELARTDPARLRDIPGIGDSSAKKILEFVTTGKVAEREELLASIPTGVPALLQIPGLGPKRVRTHCVPNWRTEVSAACPVWAPRHSRPLRNHSRSLTPPAAESDLVKPCRSHLN
jgi:plasmid stabilization system protein ParE